jgi:hypothetical protein
MRHILKKYYGHHINTKFMTFIPTTETLTRFHDILKECSIRTNSFKLNGYHTTISPIKLHKCKSWILFDYSFIDRSNIILILNKKEILSGKYKNRKKLVTKHIIENCSLDTIGLCEIITDDHESVPIINDYYDENGYKNVYEHVYFMIKEVNDPIYPFKKISIC